MILRKPLGLVFTSDELALEHNEIHLIGKEDTTIVCTLQLRPINLHTVQMRQVAVDESYQSKGIGRELVEYCEQVALDGKYNEIILHARETAIEFYLKLGYELYGEPFTEVGIPHRNMRKFLHT
ncbi:MAG: GNAT family N-acetyltransferase [Ignavibacteria bacterium]|nr:GNAT family N-acetyltransferase [Ignavibacteria bacterium]